jgi:hypothetical protein
LALFNACFRISRPRRRLPRGATFRWSWKMSGARPPGPLRHRPHGLRQRSRRDPGASGVRCRDMTNRSSSGSGITRQTWMRAPAGGARSPGVRIAIAALLLLRVSGGMAWAAPPADSDGANTEWYRSLVDKAGHGCCSIADCRPTEVTMDMEGTIWARLGPSHWVPIPRDKVLDRLDNTTGHAVVCHVGDVIYCLALAPRT